MPGSETRSRVQPPHLAEHVVGLGGHSGVEVDAFLQALLIGDFGHQTVDPGEALGGFLVGELRHAHGCGTRSSGRRDELVLRIGGGGQPSKGFRSQPGAFQRVAHVFGGHLVAHGHVAIEKAVQKPVEIPDGQRILKAGKIGDLRCPRAQVLNRIVEACDLVQARDRSENAFEVGQLLETGLDLLLQLFDLRDLVFGIAECRLQLLDVLGKVGAVDDGHALGKKR
nr:hypothetical protein [Stagnihabitans tardus]